jgi:hypothetical protein
LKIFGEKLTTIWQSSMRRIKEIDTNKKFKKEKIFKRL